MSNPDEIVMYLVARADLKMSPGKLAAQVGHGVQYALEVVPKLARYVDWCATWKAQSSTKIILKVDSRDELMTLWEKLEHDTFPARLVVDEGRTEIAAQTETVIGLIPLPKRTAQSYVGHLKLYR